MNQAGPNRSQAAGKQRPRSSASEADSCSIDHSFVIAVVAAARAVQVGHCLAVNCLLHPEVMAIAWGCCFACMSISPLN